MEIRKLFFIIADISGYTRFVTLHKESLLHAEKIIGNLLESVMEKAQSPLYVHELLGDAVTIYCPVEASSAQDILAAVGHMYDAFTIAERKHISSCIMCSCEACNNVEKLRLKIIVHVGEAAFTTVGGIKKISGEDVILTHRWLKNKIPSHEYFLFSQEFIEGLDDDTRSQLILHTEELEGLGTKNAYYKDLSADKTPFPANGLQRLVKNTELSLYAFGRKLGVSPKPFRNLPS